VTEASGGGGAVREVVEFILKAKGLWGGILKHYELAPK
jgi:3-deoxy-D-manno-octulosonate 8-phosphate phosphatase KdsC-like HAD superfamily phosphatase